MSQEWHYAQFGEQKGPVTEAEFRQLVSRGEIQPTDLVWTDGMSGWVEARKLDWLFPTFPTEPAQNTNPVKSVGDAFAQAHARRVAEQLGIGPTKSSEPDQQDEVPIRSSRRDRDDEVEEQPSSRSRKRNWDEDEDRPSSRSRKRDWDEDEEEDRPRRRGRFEMTAEDLEEVRNKKLAAGLFGILLPPFGIHKFVLGMPSAGLIMLLVTIVTCGIGGLVMGVIGLIEGIVYLSKPDQEFFETYIIGKKEWF